MSKFSLMCVASIAAAAAACSGSNEPSAPSNGLTVDMASAFSSAPAGFDQLSTSFNGSSTTTAFFPSMDSQGDGGKGFFGFSPFPKGPGFGIGFMGGGLANPFMGSGVGFFLSHDSDNCTYDATSGLHTCTATKRDGLTITRTLKFAEKGGTAEQKFDSLTDAVTLTTAVSGTETRRDSSSSTVNETSTAAVTGLSAGSAARIVNVASAGTEKTNGSSFFGPWIATRTVGDTTTALTFTSGGPLYPTSGSVVRSMNITASLNGAAPVTSNRKEVITYDGSATAKVVITHNDSTQTCTLPLPFGRLACQ